MKPMKFGVGQPARRIEDLALITGEGRYVADLMPPDALRMAVVRSPYAHARFSFGDLDAVRSMPGVRLVLTHEDVADLGPLPCRGRPKNRDGSPMDPVERPVLTRDTVRHVGEAVAVVIADTVEAARDAVDAFPVNWDSLDAVVVTGAALDPDVPLVHPERGSNLAFDALHGDEAGTDAAFAQAAHVVRLDVINNRLVANYMETRGVLAAWDAARERYELTIGSQGVHGIRDNLCDSVFRIPREQMHVVTPDVGGGFGPKIFLYAEYALALVAARKLERSVVWLSERNEHFLSDAQGRDNVSTAELALDKDLRFLGLRVDTIVNLGAYTGQYGAMIANTGATMLPGTYRLPVMSVRVRGVYTNTVPTDAYRGAGRPEALYLIERLVDVAARDLGVSPVDLRLRNFVTAAEMPYTTASGRHYDSGDFQAHLRRALAAADYEGFPVRRAESEARGLLRGFGFASYIECCAFGGENAAVRLETDGTVTVLIGTQSNGQGHKTAYAQLVAQHLDVPLERVNVVQGDSDRVLTGGGTGGSRSIPVGGVAVGRAAEALAVQLKAAAAPLLDALPDELDFSDGMIVKPGTNRSIGLTELAASAAEDERTGTGHFAQPEATYPNGTHVCEVEISPETGHIQLLAYGVVDDVGVTLNPVMLAGQVHGGIAQGLGQALLERTYYDEAGQLLTASFQDYALPRAADLVFMDFETLNVPCATNALGMKGAGEAGTIGACPAIMNAIVDALHHKYGIRHVDMPVLPEKMWRILKDGANSQ